MIGALSLLQARPGCDGTHVLVGGDRAASDDPGLALASVLGAREQTGERIPAVGLLVRRSADALWVAPALRWLLDHGRRVHVRTAVVLPRRLVECVRAGAVPVSLELAHHQPPLQRALLGAHVDSAAALLLQAQHLEAIGVPVAACLAPLLPGVHDEPGGFDPLLHNVAAADVRDVHLAVGRLSGARLVALGATLGPGALITLGRAFGLSPALLVAPPDSERVTWRLDPRVAEGLYAGLRRKALDAGLVVDACGCPSHCHLSRATARAPARPYVSITQPELFADTAG